MHQAIRKSPIFDYESVNGIIRWSKEKRNISFPFYDKCAELDNLGQRWQFVLCCMYVWMHNNDLCSNSKEIHNFVLHSFWHYESIFSVRGKNDISTGTKQSTNSLCLTQQVNTLYSIQFTLLQKGLPMKCRNISCSRKITLEISEFWDTEVSLILWRI
jgi:hypothetical protein